MQLITLGGLEGPPKPPARSAVVGKPAARLETPPARSAVVGKPAARLENAER